MDSQDDLLRNAIISRLRESFGQFLPVIAAKVLIKMQTERLIFDALRREPNKARRLPLCRLYALVATEVPEE